jgi:type II secretion system protein L
MKTLALIIPDAWASNAAWHWVHSSGQSGDLGVTVPPRARHVRLVVPSSAVLSKRVKIERRGRWKDALPYLFEESLLSDPAGLHVVAGPLDREGFTPLFAIDRADLQAWLQVAQEHGFAIEECYGQDQMLAPLFPNKRLSIDGAEGRLIGPDGVVEWLGPVAAFPEGAMEGALKLVIAANSWESLESSPVLQTLKAMDLASLVSEPLPSEYGEPVAAPNLLSGLPQGRTSGLLGFIPPYARWGVRLGLMAIALHAVMYLGQTGFWGYQDALGAQRLAPYLHAVAPNASLSSDVFAQLAQIQAAEKARREGGGAFILGLQSAEPVIALQKGPVKALHFSKDRLRLDIDCATPDCGDQLKTWASTNGWSFERPEGQTRQVSLSREVTP